MNTVLIENDVATDGTGVVKLLSVTPYVEQSCKSTSYHGWPHEAKLCHYTDGKIHTNVRRQ
jgi:hypothetical protein